MIIGYTVTETECYPCSFHLTRDGYAVSNETDNFFRTELEAWTEAERRVAFSECARGDKK